MWHGVLIPFRTGITSATVPASTGSVEIVNQLKMEGEAPAAPATGHDGQRVDAEAAGKREGGGRLCLSNAGKEGGIDDSDDLQQKQQSDRLNLPLSQCKYWWAQQDSNLRLPPCEGGTLPLSYAPLGGNFFRVSFLFRSRQRGLGCAGVRKVGLRLRRGIFRIESV